jgi:hypothetical protein
MSNYLDFSIKTRDQMKDWIMKRLGYPLVQVEITDDQLDICIDDSLEEFTKYVNQERGYIALDLENYGENGYTLPANVTSIFCLEENGGMNQGGGMNDLFSIQNNMMNAGAHPFTAGHIGSGSWVTWELANQYMDLVKRMTASKFMYEYNERSKNLTLIPDPIKLGIKGFIVIGVNLIRPDDMQYGESWVKRYSLSQAKQIIGTVRSKFSGTTLLGGASIDTEFKSEGLSEQETLLEELRSTYTFVTFFMA